MAQRTPFTFVVPALVACLSMGCGDDGPTSEDGTDTDASSTTATSAFTTFSTSGTSSSNATGSTGSTSSSSDDGSSDGGDERPWPCDALPRAGATALIDDFEGDGISIPNVDGRNGGWYSYHDGTNGSLNPYPYEHTYGDDAYAGEGAGRIHGGGFVSWGAEIGVGLYYTALGMCPYDASPYDGITFWARGNVPVFVRFSTTQTVPVAEGGSCTAGPYCWADWGVTISLTDEWQQYVVRWDELEAPTWGVQTTFDPAEVMLIHWQDLTATEFDIWIDELAFYDEDDAGEDTGSTGEDSGTTDPTDGDSSDAESTGSTGDASTGSDTDESGGTSGSDDSGEGSTGGSTAGASAGESSDAESTGDAAQTLR